MKVLLNNKGWPLTHDGSCRPNHFPVVCFSRESLARQIKRYRAECRKAGVTPSKLTIRQA
jgi:hypothetical protein